MFSSLVLVDFTFLMPQRQSASAPTLAAPLAPSNVHLVELTRSADNELTVGKVYAALMIFDFYKHNRAKRLQQLQPTGGPPVSSGTRDSTCLYFLLYLIL